MPVNLCGALWIFKMISSRIRCHRIKLMSNTDFIYAIIICYCCWVASAAVLFLHIIFSDVTEHTFYWMIKSHKNNFRFQLCEDVRIVVVVFCWCYYCSSINMLPHVCPLRCYSNIFFMFICKQNLSITSTHTYTRRIFT